MSDTTKQYVVTTVIAIVVGLASWYFPNVYFKADVRFQVGSYYRSGDIAITSLRLQNHSLINDAEDIRVTVNLPDTILDVTPGGNAVPFKIESGGKGTKSVTGTIQRLVPDEVVYLFFAVKNPDGEIGANYDLLVGPKGIVFKGGTAKQGTPISLLAACFFLFGTLVFATILISKVWNFLKTDRERQAAHDAEMKASQEKRDAEMKASQEKSNAELEKWIQTVQGLGATPDESARIQRQPVPPLPLLTTPPPADVKPEPDGKDSPPKPKRKGK